MPRPVVAYLSHSYRPDDRAINMAVWQRLNQRGIVFVVDPPRAAGEKPRAMDVTFMERMMQQSDCFVAILPDRSKQGGPSWSPYQKLECRLAIRADKPRLIVVEKTLEEGLLHDEDPVVFERNPLRLADSFSQKVDALLAFVGSREDLARPMPKVGILRWQPIPPVWKVLSENLRRELNKLAHEDITEFVDIDGLTDDNVLISRARAVAPLICDVNPRITPLHMLGLLHGAAIPTFRTCFLEKNRSSEETSRALRLDVDSSDVAGGTADDDPPSLIHGYRIDKNMTPVYFWQKTTLSDAAVEIARVNFGYRQRERLLKTQQNGNEYFLSLKGNRIFISTPGSLNKFSELAKKRLDEAGMPAFHYQSSPRPTGEEWARDLKRHMDDSDMLLAFVDDKFWESEYCRAEVTQAVSRWERHQLMILTFVDQPTAQTMSELLPHFMRRDQIGRIPVVRGLADEVIAQNANDVANEVAEDVARLFGKSDRSDIDEKVRENLERLIERYCDEKDVRAIAAEAGFEKPKELLDDLIAKLRVGSPGANRLGRLCFALRRCEPTEEQRASLGALFSRLRLLPNLHDVDAWYRRKKRRELEVLVEEDDSALYEMVTHLSGESAEWRTVVQKAGEALGKKYQQAVAERSTREVRIRAVMASSRMMVPIEWARAFDGDPLCRERPIHRRISDVAAPRRPSVEDAIQEGLTGPPRILLFGHGPAELPNVGSELVGLQSLFADAYRARGWPADLAQAIRPDDATREGLRHRLVDSDYEILHIAGHAGYLEREPVIQVRGSDGQPAWIRAEDLQAWLSRSMVRLVYLNCCTGAAPSFGAQPPAGWVSTLSRAVVQAGVPEVAAYLWPVRDKRASAFARAFYGFYLRDFDASGAMFAARKDCDPDDPVWAAAILVQQPWLEVSKG